MHISLITASQLDAPLQAAWRALQADNPALQSPYFAPEFTLSVAAVRGDVRIAVMEQAGRIAGFFPFQARWGMGLPVGGSLSDHHGVVCAPGARWHWPDLLRAARLSSWRFDHLPREQAPATSCTCAVSPALDLSRGMAAYLAGRRACGIRRLDECLRKARKLAREVGPLRFEAHTRDPRALETVLRLKSQQCRRTGVRDFFAQSWARALAERIAATEEPQFGGRLSALYAGDALVAAHLGMRARRVWHWWFPVYEHAYAPYSPGALLLLQVAQAAADEGHDGLDLGKGADAYKQSFADSGLPLAEGWVYRPSPTTAWLAARTGALRWVRSAAWAQPLRPWLRRIRDCGTPATHA
ncbi:MAG: GNAT family N-acetyltransferase [Ramlibacter sp.]